MPSLSHRRGKIHSRNCSRYWVDVATLGVDDVVWKLTSLSYLYLPKRRNSDEQQLVTMNFIKLGMKVKKICRELWDHLTFSIKSIVGCKSKPKSINFHSIPSRWYSSCSKMNIWKKNERNVLGIHWCADVLLSSSSPFIPGNHSGQRTKVFL